jgi:hypothetical protein
MDKSVDRPGALSPLWNDAGADSGHGGVLTGARPPASAEHRSSPAGVQQREGKVGNSEGGSPRRERRCGGRASVVQNRRRRCSVEAALERGEKRREGW